MMLQEMIEKTKQMIEKLRSRGLPEHVCNGSLSLLSSNEGRIALENLCENLYEFEFNLEASEKEQLLETLDYFGVQDRYRRLV